MVIPGAQKEIAREVLEWAGVAAQPHRFGGTEYRYETREIGHIRGDHLVDILFPTRVRNELAAAGRAQPYHVLPESGWVTLFLKKPEDLDQAVALLRQSYEIARRQRNPGR